MNFKHFFKVLFFISDLLFLSNSLRLVKEQHKKLTNDDFQEFRRVELQKHNELRRLNGVSDLLLDEELNKNAQNWAMHLVEIGNLEHSTGGSYGENLYCVWSSPPQDYTNGDATQAWYDEIKDYDFSNPAFSSSTGHFTQVIWKGSYKVGFGIASSDDGKDFVVANYDPPGNFIGKFQQNVLTLS